MFTKSRLTPAERKFIRDLNKRDADIRAARAALDLTDHSPKYWEATATAPNGAHMYVSWAVDYVDGGDGHMWRRITTVSVEGGDRPYTATDETHTHHQPLRVEFDQWVADRQAYLAV